MSNKENFLNFDFIPFPTEMEKETLLKESSFYKKVPWMTDDIRKLKGKAKLNMEIESISRIVSLTNEEEKRRESLIDYITSLLMEEGNKEWSIVKYGSYMTNLSIYTSDIDLTVLERSEQCKDEEEEKKKYTLEFISSILLKSKYCEYSKIINSNTPIVKTIFKYPFNNHEEEIHIDISYNQLTGISTSYEIRNFVKNCHFFKRLFRFLKYLISQRGINQSYNGGISSYLLFSLLYISIKDYFNSKNYKEKTCLSDLFINFLKFVIEFDYKNKGIDIKNGVFNHNDLRSNKKSSILFVNGVNPCEGNIGNKCFLFFKILRLFRLLYNRIINVDYSQESYFSDIILKDETLEMRCN